ncbi:FecR family protein [Methyloceanibacter stevinii]|nr:FecR domain-containing protein [Methyloceanibacter stevinii]
MGAVRAVVAFMALGAAILGAPTHAAANKVGVAAAVNPDAFSGGKEIRIGKSIFYNERISTDANGVVQVLLVDGSTFTVGKNSNVVIDKFVYDPNKKTGEIVTSFSKGSMRFIGGKISKNPGGVTVNTPDGSLAIRGGMAQGAITSRGTIFSFLFGNEMVFKSKSGKVYTVYQPGYTLDLSSGVPTIRPTTAEDIQTILASLSNGNTNTAGVTTDNQPPPQNFVILPQDFQQMIIDATGTRISDEILQQILALQETTIEQLEETSIDFTIGGYGSGIAHDDYGNYTTVGSKYSTDFDYNEDSDVITLTLHNVEGSPQPSGPNLGIFKFSPVSNNNWTLSSLRLIDHSGNPFYVTDPTGGAERRTQVMCPGCNFIEWGEFHADYKYSSYPNDPYAMQEDINNGWWVGGAVTAFKDLPTTGTATYSGTARGTILDYNLDGAQVEGRGDLDMSWSFAKRSGQLSISDFKAISSPLQNYTPPTLNVSGTMSTPGSVNRFSGDISGMAGQIPVSGGAFGSFVTDGRRPAAGVIGNWGAKT